MYYNKGGIISDIAGKILDPWDDKMYSAEEMKSSSAIWLMY